MSLDCVTENETSKQKHHLEGNVGYSHTHAHYVSGVNNCLYSNITKYLAQLCGRFCCVLENFQRKFAILVAPPTGRTTTPLVRCKAHLVL